MTRNHPARFAAAVFSSLVLIPAVGISADVLEEIIVTADFRERAASELPASVTVLSADEIAQHALQHFEELVYMVPNLNWSGTGIEPGTCRSAVLVSWSNTRAHRIRQSVS